MGSWGVRVSEGGARPGKATIKNIKTANFELGEAALHRGGRGLDKRHSDNVEKAHQIKGAALLGVAANSRLPPT